MRAEISVTPAARTGWRSMASDWVQNTSAGRRPMKAILCFSALLALSASATPEMTPLEKTIRPISDTNSCEFLKTAYFEVSHPSKIHYYAAKNVVAAGGDSYKIETTGNDTAVGVAIHTTTIGIYRCKEHEDRSAEMTAWQAEVLKKAMAQWRKPADPSWSSPCEIMAKFDGEGLLLSLSWVKPSRVRAVDKSIVRAFKDAKSFPPPPDPGAAFAGIVFTINP